MRPSRLLIAALGGALLAIFALPAGAATHAARSTRSSGAGNGSRPARSLVSALTKAGLRKTAPAMLAGNGLVPGTPKQLAAKADICKGAVPRRHSHFFTAAGQFGSVDLVLGFAPLLLGFALLLAPRVVREIAFGFLDVVVGPEG